jgi:hypothetical protein
MMRLEALMGMRALIRDGWTKSANWRVGGREATREQYAEARARGAKCACCAVGALMVVAGENFSDVYLSTEEALQLAMEKPEGWKNEKIVWINDSLRSKAQALAWLDRAIEIAQQQEERDA